MREELQNLNIYLDMDGVIAEFSEAARALNPLSKPHYMTYALNLTDEDKRIQAEIIQAVAKTGESFWSNLNWTAEGKDLYRYVASTFPNFGLLTAPLKEDPIRSWHGKLGWIAKLPDDLPKPKYLHALQDKSAVLHYPEMAGRTGVLVDDLMKNVGPWREAGGIGIQYHGKAQETIEQLQRLVSGAELFDPPGSSVNPGNR